MVEQQRTKALLWQLVNDKNTDIHCFTKARIKISTSMRVDHKDKIKVTASYETSTVDRKLEHVIRLPACDNRD